MGTEDIKRKEYMTHKKYIQLLVKFLKKKGIFSEYLLELNNLNSIPRKELEEFNSWLKSPFDKELGKYDRCDIFNKSLIWRRTKKGSDFWSSINDEWYDFYFYNS